MTLTETATLTKKVMVITLGIIILGFLSWGGYQYYYYNIYLPSIPKPEIKPDNKFGFLPKLVFPPNNVSPATYTYSLDTSTGDLPKDVPKIIKVYFIPQLGTNLLASDRARNLAATFGFINGPEILTPTQYRFRGPIGGEFIVDLNTSNFNYNYPYTLPPVATPSGEVASSSAEIIPVIADKPTIAQEFKEYLADKGLMQTQLSTGRINVFYNNGTQNQSNSGEVSIFQNDIGGLPIVTPQFTTGLIKGLAIPGSNPGVSKVDFPILYYTYWPIDETIFATYYLKRPEQAFADLKEGNARVAIQPRANKVSITLIYLAYILTEEYTPYLQPVYVFEGPNFTALVPAIDPEYVEK